MDAYDLSQRLFELWQTQAMQGPSATNLKKSWKPVPVIVELHGEMREVVNCKFEDGKVFLELK